MNKELLYNQREHDACGIGAVVNIDGRVDHRTVDDALHIVERLEHRAGKDATGKVGDGVGILVQISHQFFSKAMAAQGIDLGEARSYGIGMFFFPQDRVKRNMMQRMFQVLCEKNGLEFLGWRDVPTVPGILGQVALDSMPYIAQGFVKRPEEVEEGIAFDRMLYVIRREFEQSSEDTYVCSLSSRTIVYKGMFLVGQLRGFYTDLDNPEYQSAIGIVHSRFSTNTTPSWEKAHPYRLIAHNGEINTIRGNIDRMLAREETMESPVLEDEMDKICPVVNRNGSDSAMLDNTLEFMYMNGMELPLAIMCTIPEPWKKNDFMDQERKDFYHYYATMMEPWDGPAAILFTDGDLVGASLDRNGLRPSRYYVTDDNRLILSSEVGVLDIPAEHIVEKSRLMPGRILLIDTKAKRLIPDEEVKKAYASRKPYGEWLDMNLLHMDELKIPNKKIPTFDQDTRDKMYKVFGYTYEEVNDEILTMAKTAAEPVMSMGHDVPLAVLSEKHQPLFNYFKQLFAQVTNPPIDSLRERIVTDTTVYIGSDGNLLQESGQNARVLEVDNPILDGVDIMKIRSLNQPGFKATTLPIVYYKNTSLERALDQLNVSVDRAFERGYNIIILSDRAIDENHVPIPSLLAVSSVEQHLVATRKRTAVSLILESGEPRDVHQFATLLGFGARAIYPYLAQECIAELIDLGILDKDYHTAIEDYNKAILTGIVKTAAKMGISTLQSYQSARIFEAIGLSKEVIDKYFTGTVSRIGGIGLKEIAEGVTFRHNHAFDPMGLAEDTTLDSVGFHRLRSGANAENHMYRPETIVTLQQAVRNKNYDVFKEYSSLVDDDKPHTLRGLMAFHPVQKSIPIEEVEPIESIVKRFQTGAMSFGSISPEAHTTLAKAMNQLGGRSNTGEGGEDDSRFGTDENSRVKQVASGRFGVTEAYLVSADEIQIKMAQGAKPGEGGNLPGRKVNLTVAKARYSTPGVSLVSPPPHHDIYSIEDLAELIYDLKNANPKARISVKLVSEAGVGTIACGVAKAGAQVILISGYDGGTGAAPYSSIHHAGLPWELGVAEAQQALMENGLRDRVVLETDSKLMTGRDVAIAALLGAEEYGFATAPLVALGCSMMRVCSKDTCPQGIATQNPELRKRFKGKPEHVINYMCFVAQELREIMAALGFHTVSEMIGRTDCLQPKAHQITHRAETVKLSGILDTAYAGAKGSHFDPKKVYDFKLQETVDESQIIPEFKRALKTGEKHSADFTIKGTDRTLGTIFGSEVTQRFGDSLEEDTFTIHCHGAGGQSFGAFLPKGVTLTLEGDANDGVGKGLSGGKIVVTPPEGAAYQAADNIIVGNVALYGATSGTAYFTGIAGERFLVRNSGATAVAEGCGDHGLEYMTGGRAVILGPTGKNLAAGMSGGIAYVLDMNHDVYRKLNKDMVFMTEVTEKYDVAELRQIITDYMEATHSVRAQEIMDDFENYLPYFKKIIPNDYHKMILSISHFEEQGISHENAVKEAFQAMQANA